MENVYPKDRATSEDRAGCTWGYPGESRFLDDRVRADHHDGG